MKKLLFFAFVAFSTSQFSAQVGVGLAAGSAPQKALHVSGNSVSTTIAGTGVQLVTPTVRIDGLNNTNQVTSEKLRPVSVTSNGDLVLSAPMVVPKVMIDPILTSNAETDYLPTTIIFNQTATGANNIPLRTFSFVLENPSIVKFGAVTSFQFFNATNGNVIVDNSNRIWGTKFRLTTAPAGVPVNGNAYFGESLHGYSNLVNNTAATGIYYSNSEESLYLPAGNYSVEISAYVDTQNTQTFTRVVNGAGTDTVNIIAYPAQ